MVNRPPENNDQSCKADESSSNEQSTNRESPARKSGNGETTEEFDEFSMSQPPSAVALKLRKLKSASFKAAQARERLPHPLFWSLFLTEVSELKKKKEEKRLLDRILLGVGTE